MTTLPVTLSDVAQRISGTHDSAMPDDLRQAAVVRLYVLLKIMFFLHVAAIVLNLVGPGMFQWSPACALLGAIEHGFGLVLTGVFIATIRRGRTEAETLLNWALGYQVVTCFVAAYAEQVQGTSGISIVAVLILMFPLFVPRDVRKTLIAGLSSALVAPLAVALFRSMATQALPPVEVVPLVMNFVFAGFAVVPSKVMAHLARQVKSARRMGAYELTSKLGAGGMGEVWRARHRLLRRPAAIKLIRPEALGRSDANLVLSRFEREAQATAGLESPHTVELYDFGVAQDNSLYYVMELLNGQNLESHVAEFGPMPAERVVYILRQVLDSLDDAHSRGLVHRDIKPANILICRKGRQYDFVKVVDFGLVRITADSEQASKITETGEGKILGTPAYLAPEAVTGSDPIDGRSDLYAVGCVAYFLLTGHNVFEANSPMSMAVAHATETPSPPSSRGVPVPRELDALILACLRKRPGERPADAYSLSQKLAQVPLERPWTNERAEAFWTGHLSDKAFLYATKTAISEAPTAIVEPMMSA